MSFTHQDMFHPSSEQEAVLSYESSRYRVIKPGSYVRCAITGAHIPLRQLKYWNVQRGEAYASAKESLESHLAHLSR